MLAYWSIEGNGIFRDGVGDRYGQWRRPGWWGMWTMSVCHARECEMFSFLDLSFYSVSLRILNYECWNHIVNDTLSNHLSLTFSRRVHNKELQENVILYSTMIIYTLQIIPRYMNNETKLHRLCSAKLSETTSFHIIWSCSFAFNIKYMQQASLLKV